VSEVIGPNESISAFWAARTVRKCDHPVGAEDSNWIADQDFLGVHPMVSHRRYYRITGRRSLGKYRRSFWYIVPGRFVG
jgi:hypothetical protein